jgi:hypothetical protein
VIRYYLKSVLGICALVGACAAPRPARETPAAAPYDEDEFAARAAALQKTCELAVVYLGTDDARAAAVVEQARVDALEAVRRAPDAYRGVVFARAFERLEGAAAALAGVGDYSPPLSDSEYERLRGELLSAAAELRPLGEPYYLKVARRYEGLGRRRRVEWGPRPPPEERALEARPAPRAPPAPAEAPPPEEPSPETAELPPPETAAPQE